MLPLGVVDVVFAQAKHPSGTEAALLIGFECALHDGLQVFVAAFTPAFNAVINDRLGGDQVLVKTDAVLAAALDLDAAVKAAREGFEGEWGSWSAEQRADLLDAVADRITDRFDELVQAESWDTGKPMSLAAAVDIPRARDNFRFFAGAIRHESTGCHIMGTPTDGAINYTLRKPVGVAGLITPWNLPLYLCLLISSLTSLQLHKHPPTL